MMDDEDIIEYRKAQRIKKQIKNYIENNTNNRVTLENLYLEAKFYGFIDEFPPETWKSVDKSVETKKEPVGKKAFKAKLSATGKRPKSFKKVISAFSGSEWSPQSLPGDKWVIPSADSHSPSTNRLGKDIGK